MKSKFEQAFLKAVKKHSSIKKNIENKVRMIMEHPLKMGEPLKDKWRGFYSCPVKKNFIIIYLYCTACRKKGDDSYVACYDCKECENETIKFIVLGPHDETYGL